MTRKPNPLRTPRAVVLLEVVLSMAIFVAIASVALMSLDQCTRAVNRLRLEARAADIAVTILSEIQMGLLDPVDAGPETMTDPLAEWTWQVFTRDDQVAQDLVPMREVEIVVSNPGRGFVYRLAHMMPVEEAAVTVTSEPTTAETPTAAPAATGPATGGQSTGGRATGGGATGGQSTGGRARGGRATGGGTTGGGATGS